MQNKSNLEKFLISSAQIKGNATKFFDMETTKWRENNLNQV